MKKRSSFLLFFTAVIFIIVNATIRSSAADDSTLISNKEKREILAEIFYKNQEEKISIIETGIDITNADKEKLTAILKASEINKLTNLGFDLNIITKDYRMLSPFYENKSVSKPYHNYSDIKQYMENAASQNPNFIKYYTLGKSVKNRDIIALKITDNPEIEEIEPEVRILALHHGDELCSSEFALYLIKYIIEKYNSNDAEIKELINSTEIWIVPMVNPDGMENTFGPSRYNANEVDLNRNYSNPEGFRENETAGDYDFSEPETSAIRDFSLPYGSGLINSFVLSLSFHGGALYFNYVWNYKSAPTPDEALLIHQGNYYKKYCLDAGLKDFDIINGFDWYRTYGDTNDWAYGFTAALDTTIEMSSDKTPRASTQTDIDNFCYQQLNGTLYSIWLSGEGIRGRVIDEDTSQSILANILVKEVPKPVYTDPSVYGDFYKVLLPGTYNLEISAESYTTRTISNIQVGASEAHNKKRNYTDLGIIKLKKDFIPQRSNLWITR